ncbi:MAG: glycosyltransferase family 2 protein [Flavipsychrobacter sp.]|nr:glycosyltransferase family 2 protein [Flavipsychrobacter sp.]
MQPKVSVIVPCYNYAKFLPFALDSLLAQSLQEWECVIVDDGSSDDTGHVARAYVNRDGRFRYIYQQNKGLSAARNTGLVATGAPYIQLLDADDLLDERKLQLQAAYLDEHTQVAVLYGDEAFFHTNTPEQRHKGRDKSYNRDGYLKRSGSGQEMVAAFAVNNFISVSSPLIRRSLVNDIGNFDTAYRSYEDWHFWFRAAAAGAAFAYEPIPGTETYIRYGHTSMLTNQAKLTEAGIRIRKFMMPYLPVRLKLYNTYRLSKLFTRSLLQGKK